jgi:hypothetical protein
MTIPLSERTKELIQILFPPELSQRVEQALLDQVSENIPFSETDDPVEMERIRFSVIRLIHDYKEELESVIDLAKTDCRDLFMAADHGEPSDHMVWYRETTRMKE